MWHHQLRILDPESFSQCQWSESRWEMIIWVFLEIGVQNHGFSYRKPLKTPWIILKPSSSRNFQLAIASGNQPWFAGKFPCLVQWLSQISSMFAGFCWNLWPTSSWWSPRWFGSKFSACCCFNDKGTSTPTWPNDTEVSQTEPQIQKPARWTETWDPGPNVICSFGQIYK